MEQRRSQSALDWVVFFLSDVETGVGPFIAGYLTGVKGWNPEQIGIIIAAQKIASVVTQASAGWLIDRTRLKRWIMAAAALAISCGSVFVVWSPGVFSQSLNQVGIGAATSVATLTVSALSLGLVGREALSRRLGRNGAFSHAGNMVTASLAGYAGFRIGQQWIFYFSAALGVACSVAALAIRESDIDHAVAREAPDPKETSGAAAAKASTLLRSPAVLIFGLVVLLFHFSNSALLPLAGEEISRYQGKSGALYLTACIVLPQVVMIPVSWLTGRRAHQLGRKLIWSLAFGALVLRGVLFALTTNPNLIVAVEVLDGIGTGIAGVITVLVVADLAKGTGRFNALGGMMQSGLGIGAFLGNLLAGSAAKRLGFPPVFYGLSAVALLGLLLLATAMPETKPVSTKST
ncbi:MAG: MFS transporter [Bryobacteraceae bacterium]